MSAARQPDEIRQQLLEHLKGLSDYWATGVDPNYSIEERLDGLLHSVLTTIDGSSTGFDCRLDLVCRPHPDDKAAFIDEGNDWIEDGTVLNANIYLNEEWA